MTPGSALETVWDTEARAVSAVGQASSLLALQLLRPHLFFFYCFYFCVPRIERWHQACMRFAPLLSTVQSNIFWGPWLTVHWVLGLILVKLEDHVVPEIKLGLAYSSHVLYHLTYLPMARFLFLCVCVFFF